MSLNQSAEVGVAGYGGVIAGQYEPLTVPVFTKTSNNKLTGTALTRGNVITVEKFGANQGKIRIATSGDEGPFGMVFSDAASSDTRVEYISMQQGFIGYIISDGAIKPGQNVIVSTSTNGQVEAEVTTATVTGAQDLIVGTYISKGVEVSKSGSGVYTPSDAADGDIIRVAFASTRGEIY